MKTVLIVLRLFLILGISVSALAQEGQRNQGNAPPELGNNLKQKGSQGVLWNSQSQRGPKERSYGDLN